LSSIAFRCNHSFLEFRGIMFPPIPQTARLAVLLPIFSRHMLYGGQVLMGLHYPLKSWPNSCPSVSFDILLEQRSEPPVCALHTTLNWNLASRYYSWPCYELLLICFLNRLRRFKNLRISQLCPEEIRQTLLAQSHAVNMFPNEIVALTHKRLVPKNSPFFVLNPYLDENKLICIRGRRRARLPGVNPIVLHAHPLLVLITQHYRR